MEFIVENWYVIVTGIVFIVGGVMAVLRWRNLSTDKKYEQIRGWLLQAVLGAEREFGSGTGKLKLSSVYDKFCERFPWLAKVLPFETFSKYVDDPQRNERRVETELCYCLHSGAEGRGKIIIRGGFSYDRARDRTVN